MDGTVQDNICLHNHPQNHNLMVKETVEPLALRLLKVAARGGPAMLAQATGLMEIPLHTVVKAWKHLRDIGTTVETQGGKVDLIPPSAVDGTALDSVPVYLQHHSQRLEPMVKNMLEPMREHS